MTAKQRLAEKIDEFSEEEAAEALCLLGLEEGTEWPEFPPASLRVMDQFRRAMADSDAGRSISDEEFGRRFGLD
jgi:hypothetical protein